MGDNIKIQRQKTRCGRGLDWYGSGQRQLVGSCEIGDEESCSRKCAEFFE